MSWEDGPPEPTEEEQVEHETSEEISKNPVVRIDGLTAADVHAVIAGLVERKYDLDEVARKAIMDQAARVVSALTEENVKDAVRGAVDDALRDGIHRYNSYNGQVESITTIKEMVQKELAATKSDNYGSPKMTVAQQVVAETVKALFTKELQGEIDAIKKDFRAQADAVFKAKLVDGLKEAIGLK